MAKTFRGFRLAREDDEYLQTVAQLSGCCLTQALEQVIEQHRERVGLGGQA